MTLSETSLQDTVATLITETEIELGNQQVPIPFELASETSNLDTRFTYTLRATISGPGGDLQWTTDTANPIDVTQTAVDLGSLILVQVAGGDSDRVGLSASSIVGEWNVIEIVGAPILDDAPATLVFGDDGTMGELRAATRIRRLTE